MRRKPLFPPPANAAGKPLRNKGRQRRSVLTVNGRVSLQRRRWLGEETCTTPLDAKLDTSEKTFTRGVRELLCRLNQCSASFAKTAENLQRLSSLSISGETTRQIVEAEGRAAVASMQRGRLDFGWTAQDCQVPEHPGKTRIYQGCDGVKVPVVTDAEKRKRRERIKTKRRKCGRKRRPLPPLRRGETETFREVRVVTQYDETQTRRAVVVTRGDGETAGRLIRALCVQLKTEAADESIALIDGAPWIRAQYEFHGAAKRIGLDFYHWRDYAQRTRREIFGEGTAEGDDWLKRCETLLFEQGVEALCDNLWECRRSLRGRKRAAVDRLLNYMGERIPIMRYQEFRERGWQIGSGPTEAQCKSTTHRVKGRGRRWDLRNAEAIMALAALESSRAWTRWWSTPSPIPA